MGNCGCDCSCGKEDSTNFPLQIEKINPEAIVPKRSNFGDSGLDLYSVEDAVIDSEKARIIATGWKMSVPFGFEIQVRSRSGLAAKNQVFVLNSPGTVDCSYRGEVKVILYNEGKESFTVKKGDRIAQMVVAPVLIWEPSVVDKLDDTVRGEGGFGSTGR